ncbi:MAG: hypothetical protein WBB04_06830 [Candidatus Macondimonas sp.]
MRKMHITHGPAYALLVFFASATLAESSFSPEDIIRERQRSYESLNDELAQAAQLLKQGNTESMSQIRPLSQSLVATGAHLRDAF